MNVNITGIMAEAKKSFETFKKLRPVGFVSLVPDPDNVYDPFCIQVVYETESSLVLLGYIPAQKKDGKYVGSELQKYILDNKITKAAIIEYGYIDESNVWNQEHRGHLQSVTIDLEVPETDSGKSIGAKYQRVTSFIRYFDGYGGGDGLIKWAFEIGHTFEEYETHLKELALSGTRMHNAIETSLKGEATFKDGENTLDTKTSLPEGWGGFIAKYEIDVVSTETRFFDNDLRVTGQRDVVAFVKRRGTDDPLILSVLDWKSKKKAGITEQCQLSIYAKNTQFDGEYAKQALCVCFGTENKQKFSVATYDFDKIEKTYIAMKHLRACIDATGVYISKFWEDNSEEPVAAEVV